MLWILPLMVVAVLGFALGFRILSNSERKWDLALRWVLTAILAAIVLVLDLRILERRRPAQPPCPDGEGGWGRPLGAGPDRPSGAPR